MTETQHSRAALMAIALGFLILAVVYSVVTPVFEASDEISHYPVVQHIATTGALPVQNPDIETLWEQEGSQPPLYYLISAGLTFWIDTSDLEQVRWRNPHAKLGIPLDPDNRNMVIHTEAEDWPWRGTVLAVHLIRFFSVALGTVTILLTYLIAREAAPDSPWIPPLAAAIAAFNPMFLFITGSVNNDNLTVMLSSLVILLCARILRTGLTPHRTAALAIAASLATITKISGLTLLPVIGLTLLVYSWHTGEWRRAFYAGIMLAAVWVVLGSWWYIRNLLLYRELFGLNTHVAIAGGREIGLLSLLGGEWYGFWVSYWALFGAVNILAEPYVYLVYALLSMAAVIGLVVCASQHLRQRVWDALIVPGLFVVQALVVFVGVIRWTMMTYASQGRLVFPAIAGLSTLTALGLLHLIPSRWHAPAASGVGVLLLAIAAAAPFRYIAPAYALPPAVDQIPEDAVRVNAQFRGLELVAAQVEPVIVEEGGRIPVALYWRANEAIQEDFSLYLHAFGRDYEEIGKIDSFPGAGSLPTSRMQPGIIYLDQYSLELDQEFNAPTAIRVQIGVALHEAETYKIVEPTSEDGLPTADIVLRGGVAYPHAMDTCQVAAESDGAQTAYFGGLAQLWIEPLAINAQPGDEVPIPLVWDRTADTPIDWTVFVHLVDSSGQPMAQADAPPLNGFYPTSLWKRPCVFLDMHTLAVPPDVPAGSYRILVGLYDPNDPAYARAAAVDSTGSPYPNDAVTVGTVRITLP